MRKIKLKYASALFFIIGFPLLFIILSIVTKNWTYFLWSIPPILMSGWTGMIVSRKERAIKE